MSAGKQIIILPIPIAPPNSCRPEGSLGGKNFSASNAKSNSTCSCLLCPFACPLTCPLVVPFPLACPLEIPFPLAWPLVWPVLRGMVLSVDDKDFAKASSGSGVDSYVSASATADLRRCDLLRPGVSTKPGRSGFLCRVCQQSTLFVHSHIDLHWGLARLGSRHSH